MSKKKKVLGKFMILCWATFIAILGHGLDTPVSSVTLLLVQSMESKLLSKQKMSKRKISRRKGNWLQCEYFKEKGKSWLRQRYTTEAQWEEAPCPHAERMLRGIARLLVRSDQTHVVKGTQASLLPETKWLT